MSAPFKPIRPVRLHTTLPEDMKAKLDLYLYSEAEQRIPKGALQEFLMERIEEFFSSRRLDLESYGFPPGMAVKGSKATIEHLKYKLDLYVKEP